MVRSGGAYVSNGPGSRNSSHCAVSKRTVSSPAGASAARGLSTKARRAWQSCSRNDSVSGASL
ncbi:Uncharacterised protein [Bordetella pertussis]|nr:Uncharacterised protein [Bordetella pertussis]CFO96320.1 Uncharacterised protein [Bordetella pertussis]CFW33131.1 Uncharacterised protein [Bordetella pertussis]CPI82398.1 Uncharacterised protein [Bordetella pertussis]CPP34655.1 Uncharacterised protein [Bordetella pertussis]